MKNTRAILSLSALALALGGCTSNTAPVMLTPSSHPAMAAHAPTGVGVVGPGSEPVVEQPVNNAYKPITVRVTGSGAAPYTKSLTPSQRKLLAIRAARLDAFRAIAEQVQGMRLVGNSTVSNMIVTNDSFRSYVDAYLRGVNILSTTMKADGTSEAIAEITLDYDFYQQFRQAMNVAGGSVVKAAQSASTTGTLSALQAAPDVTPPRYSGNFYISQ